jgi:hypothetical protein
MWKNAQRRERTEEMWEQPSAFCSTEVVSGLGGRQSRQNAEDASGACCPGRVGMEVGKGQQAQARKKLGGRMPDSSANAQSTTTTAH